MLEKIKLQFDLIKFLVGSKEKREIIKKEIGPMYAKKVNRK